MRNAERGFCDREKNQKGVSLIAALFIIIILAFMGVMFVSLIGTGSLTAVNDLQGTQAFYIAEGGLQYAGMKSFPNMSVAATGLGAGSFSVAVPTLTAAINNAVTTINVSSIDGFDATGGAFRVMLCDSGGNATPNITSASNSCEKLSFTGTTPTSFTGGTRGADGTAAAAHLQNAVVLMYTWDTTINATLNKNASPVQVFICVNSTARFAGSGIIRINDAGAIEDVLYTGTNSGAACGSGGCPGDCFTGCVRKAFTGVGSNHTGVQQIYPSEVSVLATSTGNAGNGVRRVQGGFMPLQ